MTEEKKDVLVFVFEGFADWESAYVCTELNGSARYRVRTVGLDGEPVRSMGGLRVVPDCTVAEHPHDFAALLLIGGNVWLDGSNDAVLPLVEEALDSGAAVGGICNAASFLAEHGFLDERAHTGNTLEYLKQCAPHYRGDALFREEQAVADRGVVTANGAGTLEFACAVLSLLEAKPDDDVREWYRLHKEGFYPASNAEPLIGSRSNDRTSGAS